MSIRRHRSISLVLVALVHLSARAQTIEPDFQPQVVVPNDSVTVVEVAEGEFPTIYIAGPFDQLGIHTGAVFVADAVDGGIQPPTAFFQGSVHAVVSDGGGGWYVGGDGLAVDGEIAGGLVHILPDGSVDTDVPFVAGDVFALTVRETTVYLGGDFGQVGSTSRENLAALDTSTQALTTWAPQVDGLVFALDTIGSTVYVGGFFDDVNGTARNHVAALDDGGNLLPWNPSAGGTVRTLVAVDESVYVGGWFTSVDGQPRSRIAAIDAVSGQVSAWDPGVDNGAQTLAVTDDVVYAGGLFTTAGGTPRSCAAAFDRATGAVLAWNPDVTTAGDTGNLEVLALHVLDDEVVLGGSFRTVGGASRQYVAFVDATTGAPSSRTLDVGGSPTMVHSISGDGESLAVGGSFEIAGAEPREQVARIDPISGAFLEWSPPIASAIDGDDASIFDIFVADSTTFIAGFYRDLNNRPQPLLLAVDSITGALVPGFTTPTLPAESIATSLALVGDTLYVGYDPGEGLGSAGLGVVDAATGVWGGFLVETNNSVMALTLNDDGSMLFFGGEFAEPRQFVGLIDTASATLDPWAADIGGPVHDIELFGDSVYVGGEFSLVEHTPRFRAAALDVSTGALLDWNPVVDGAGTYYLSALDRVGARILLAGRFDTVSGVFRPGIAAVDSITAEVGDWAPSPSSTNDVASSPTFVAVGGEFSTIAGAIRPHLAVFLVDPGLDCNENGIPDDFEVSQGLAPDCDGNGVPDECDPDCNGNMTPDACDIADGTSLDCNTNEVPDECDIDLGTSPDCNENGVPDECEATIVIEASSGPLAPIGVGFPQTFTIHDVVPATTDVCFSFAAHGDFSSSSERIDVDINGNFLITVFQIGGADFAEPPLLAEFFLPPDMVNDALAGSDTLALTMTPTSSVDPNQCDDETYISVSIYYRQDGPNDSNDDGIPDDCQTLCPTDINADAEVGFDDLLAVLSAWGPCSADCPVLCPEDVDGDGEVAFGDLLSVLSTWGTCM